MSKALQFSPRLIQRLTPPYEQTPGKVNVSEVFAFGGGLKNGGLSDEAMKLLSPHFSFDYMGAAEFEFGELPKALRALAAAAERGEAVAKMIRIDVTPPEEKNGAKVGGKPMKFEVYVIASNEEHLETIQAFLQSQTITDQYGWPKNKDFRTKEATRIWSGLTCKEEDMFRTIGGIDIEHSWMWFAKRETFDGICKIFGLKASAEG